MARLTNWVIPAVVMAAWAASVFLIEEITGDGNDQALLALGFSILAGLLAGRWWVLLVPVALAVVVGIYGALDPCEDCRDEITAVGAVAILVIYVGLLDFGLAVGVALRQGIALLAGRT
jgi:hypothetical protein